MIKNILIILWIFCPLTLLSQDKNEGALLVMGGNTTNDFFLTHFASLCGGVESKIVLIPTAMEEELLDSKEDIELLTRPFTEFGFIHVVVAHTRNKDTANSKAFNEQLLDAGGVWITGGRQWRLAEAYNGTEVINSLKTLLDNKGVIAGTSAGASIMASFLARGDENHSLALGKYQEGFGFIDSCAIDQHYLARNRQFDMFEILRNQPQLLGIGIDEKTGIIVRDRKFRIVGSGYVGIYDGTRWSEEKDTIYQLDVNSDQFYLLSEDLEYDLLRRRIIFPEDRLLSKASQEFLAVLTGTYRQLEGTEIGMDLKIEISLENERLYFTNSWNLNKYEICFDHANVFFRPNSNAVYYFDKDKLGDVNSFKFYQHGSTTWEKLIN